MPDANMRAPLGVARKLRDDRRREGPGRSVCATFTASTTAAPARVRMRTGAGLAAVLAALVAPALEVGDVHAGMRARARPTGRVIAPASWSIMCRHMIDPRRPEHRLRWIVAAAAGALLPLAWVALSGHRIAWGDTTFMFAPLRPLVVEALRAGHLPLWNPYEGGGIPLFAQMVHGVLHPLSVIGALVAPGASMDVFVAAWVALAAAGAAVLACDLGASPAASAVSGLAFGLSGYVLGMSVNILYLAGAASAPWVVAALRFAGRDGRLGTAAAAAAFACAAFAGDPQWAIVAAVLGAALAADAGGLGGLARAGAGIALGVAIAAGSSRRARPCSSGWRSGDSPARSRPCAACRCGVRSVTRRSSSGRSPCAQ